MGRGLRHLVDARGTSVGSSQEPAQHGLSCTDLTHAIAWSGYQNQVSGSLVFDVPKGLILGTIFCDEVEYIPVDFVDYWKDRD